MNHPQTVALDISRKLTKQRLETINKYGCCAFVLLWCLGIEPDDDFKAIETVSNNAINNELRLFIFSSFLFAYLCHNP